MSNFSEKFINNIKESLTEMDSSCEHVDFGNVLEYIKSLEADVEYWKSKAMKPTTMYDRVVDVSRKVNPRMCSYVMLKVMEEVGELAEEVNINSGFINKPVGKDGVLGEAIDVIVTVMDIIYLTNPDITNDELTTILDKKLSKWYNNCKQV
ncbi:MAG: hypothetical protein CL489_08580 [Acidobacteria bacterium]|nr:hypothetical protein [Acidobacteriota bacterium]|tara:strand:- start:39931 stop:40383 length:453 start_codon:yes stop_codon:yes gene_type:complete